MFFFSKKQKISRFKFTAGFTLVELLVTITIFVMLTGVVLFSQTKFNGTVMLTNLTYDTALTIRQAQTFGVNIKEYDAGGASAVFVPYGVHFEMTNPNSLNTSFILYADTLYNSSDKNPHGFAGDPSLCPDKDPNGCVTRYVIKKGNFISKITYTTDGTTFRDLTVGDKIDLVFVRPDPDAKIIFTPLSGSQITGIKEADVTLGSPDGGIRQVVVKSTGLISVTPR